MPDPDVRAVVSLLPQCEETYRKLIEVLERLDMKVMFFQAHRAGEPQMKGAYRDYGCDEFVEFMPERSPVYWRGKGKADLQAAILRERVVLVNRG